MIKKMGKFICAGMFLVALFSAVYVFDNRLFLYEAQVAWPQKNFNESIFRNSSVDEKAGMVFDLIKSKRLIGVDSDKISDILGDPDGDYYNQDVNKTYKLTERGDADWILTVTVDNHGRVNQVFIRKSCCSITKKILNFIFF